MSAFALALLLTMACASPGDLPLRVPAARSATLAAASAGQDSLIQVRVGEAFVITLQSNPSTGHRWTVADSLGPLLRLREQTYVPQQPVSVGSGGHERLTFVAQAAGETVLRLRYSRGVQRSAPRRTEFGVRIHPAEP
ncbi:MAG TPA: protease inhibitor I42 family protein [Longimicrobium sp.]